MIPGFDRSELLDPALTYTELGRMQIPGDLTGQTIRGYDLTQSIGAGGFGAVYRAYQAAVRREVAVKVILPRYADQPEFIRRFEAEAQIVARLEHPYIVPLYDYWREPGGAYLVMRWLPGGSLRALVKRESLPLADLVHILDQISMALAFAHRRGVIHLDLKPDNILLDEDRNGYLADFGIARQTSEIAQEEASGRLRSGEPSRTISGTPTYIAPEQIQGLPITAKTDLYSLGIMLYELLIGQPPFETQSTEELMLKHLYETLPALALHRDDLPTALDLVLRKATAKDPADRYPDAPSIAIAFREALGELAPASAINVTDLRRTPRRSSGKTPVMPPSRASGDPLTATPIAARPPSRVRMTDKAESEASRSAPSHDPVDDRTIPPTGSRTLHLSPPGSAALTDSVDNPYKGLRAFEEADAADFFGREALIGRLGDRLAESDPLARFLAVVGPSGSGKSSAVKAGLIPALRNGSIGALPDSSSWFVVEMTPGTQPFTELADALQRVAMSPIDNLLARLTDNADGLLSAVRELLPADPRVELLLVIDQFEEVFTQGTDPADAGRFLESLLTAVTATDSRLHVIVTLRADFYDRPLLVPGFGDLVRQRTEVVLPLAANDLRRVIAQPAERVGLSLEAGLIEAMLHDVGDQPGALPLVQYALTELFERRQGRTLTLNAYRESGGVIGALARRADLLFEELDSADQTLARQIFLRLITPGEGVEDTRRRALRPELSLAANYLPDQAVQGETAIDAILSHFGDYRLLTFDRDPLTRVPTIEIAHEALIRSWARLRSWIATSRDDLTIQRRVASATAEWIAAGRDAGYLATDARLTQFQTWQTDTSLALSRDEEAYLDASEAQHAAMEARDQARKAREAAIARRAQTFARTAAILGVVGVLAIFATIAAARQVSVTNQALDVAGQTLTPVPITLTPVALTLVAGNIQIVAARATGTGVAQQIVSVQLAAAANRELNANQAEPAILLDLAALKFAYSPQADTSLAAALDQQYALARLSGHTASINAVAMSPDGKTILSGSNDGTARLWNLNARSPIRTISPKHGHILSVAFAPDNRSIALGLADKVVQVWDSTTGTLIREVPIDGAALAVAFSPDGSQLAVGSESGLAVIFNVSSGLSLRTLSGHTGAVDAIAYAPDGKSILTGSADHTARLWDAATGALRTTLTGHDDSVLAVAFSPDGSQVLTGSADLTAKLWQTATGQPVQTLTGASDSIDSVAFSPDGTAILTAGLDGTAAIWDLGKTSPRRVLIGHTGAIGGATFSPDGRDVITGGADGDLRLWAADSIPGELIGHVGNVNAVAAAPDGKTIMTAGSDGTVRQWDAATDIELHQFAVKDQPVESVAVAPDGKTILAGYVDDKARLWDIASGQIVHTFEGHTGQINAVAYSPDGRSILTGSADHTARLWDVATGSLRQTFTQGDGVSSVAFSADGGSILTGSYDGTVKLWDTASGALRQTFDAHTLGKVITVAFAPDGHAIVLGGEHGAQLWTIQNNQQGGPVAQPITGADVVRGVAFAPDGKQIALVDDSGSVRLFAVGANGTIDGSNAARIWTAHAGSALSVAFTPDGSRLVTGGSDGKAHLWPVDLKAALATACTRLIRDPADQRGIDNQTMSLITSIGGTAAVCGKL